MRQRRVSLGPVRHCGPVTVAAVEEVVLEVMPGAPPSGRVVGLAAKRPLAIVIRTPGGLVATEPDGRPMTLATLDALCPGARDRLTPDLINQGGPHMQTKDIIQYAHALYDAHGDKAEAEAAQKAAAARDEGNAEDAEKWDKIRAHIKELRGPKST
ncbi:hypothetical protein roselon_03314 [Roseibacterium elongatum DSM 19469]|uniref:Uncharacterized protein n=1 Tax=Roseicyclus elongatus DSM 19469 TaxID=1294273 RepID=W8S5S2_9RHOB|nr:hypothetical protein [Roseibacterium elongatum]AHM05572.1 hypothetical protein roselon_03314 [Roseibacterium elongatum DSM 19469]